MAKGKDLHGNDAIFATTPPVFKTRREVARSLRIFRVGRGRGMTMDDWRAVQRELPVRNHAGTSLDPRVNPCAR